MSSLRRFKVFNSKISVDSKGEMTLEHIAPCCIDEIFLSRNNQNSVPDRIVYKILRKIEVENLTLRAPEGE